MLAEYVTGWNTIRGITIRRVVLLSFQLSLHAGVSHLNWLFRVAVDALEG